jgi:hypothetical protein
MNAQPITYQELRKAIKVSFEQDKKLKEYYDPNAKVETLEDVINDVTRKLLDHEKDGGLSLLGVYNKKELVGYFVRRGGMLISFGLAVKYRVRKFKREFFNLIREEFKGMFICFLWQKNVRAIRFMMNMGMEDVSKSDQVCQLVWYNK